MNKQGKGESAKELPRGARSLKWRGGERREGRERKNE